MDMVLLYTIVILSMFFGTALIMLCKVLDTKEEVDIELSRNRFKMHKRGKNTS